MHDDYERTKKAAREAGDRDEEYRLGARELREIKADIGKLETRVGLLSDANTDRIIEINGLTGLLTQIKENIERLEAMLEKAEEKYETKESAAPFKKAVTWFAGLIVTGFLTAVGALVYRGGGK